MLVAKFKFKRLRDRNKYEWIGSSDYEKNGLYRGFTVVGKTLSDVKAWANIVRWCERTGKLEDLSSHVYKLEQERGLQSTWGGNWYHWRHR